MVLNHLLLPSKGHALKSVDHVTAAPLAIEIAGRPGVHPATIKDVRVYR